MKQYMIQYRTFNSKGEYASEVGVELDFNVLPENCVFIVGFDNIVRRISSDRVVHRTPMEISNDAEELSGGC